MIGRGYRVGIAVVDRLVLTVGLQLMHSTSTQSTVIASLSHPFRAVPPFCTLGLLVCPPCDVGAT